MTNKIGDNMTEKTTYTESGAAKDFNTDMEEIKWQLDKLASSLIGDGYWVNADVKHERYDTTIFTITATPIPYDRGRVVVPYTPMELEYISRADSDTRLDPHWLNRIFKMDSGTYMLCGWIKGDSRPLALRRYNMRFLKDNKVQWFESNSWLGLNVEQLLMLVDKGCLQPAGQQAGDGELA